MMGDTITTIATSQAFSQTADDTKRGEHIVATLDILLQDCEAAFGQEPKIVLALETEWGTQLDSIRAKNEAYYDICGASRLHYIAKAKISEVSTALVDLRQYIDREVNVVEPATNTRGEREVVKIALPHGGYTMEAVDVPDTEMRKCDMCREEMPIKEMDFKGREKPEHQHMGTNAGGWQYVCRKINCRQGQQFVQQWLTD